MLLALILMAHLRLHNDVLKDKHPSGCVGDPALVLDVSESAVVFHPVLSMVLMLH